jgi:ligand-binding sensor domain-containing protein
MIFTNSKISFLLFMIIFPLYCIGQEGNILLKHYSNSISGTGNENPIWDMKQANNEIMYFATSHGIISYDGVKWKNIKTQEPAFSIALDSKKENIYVACQNSFGFIETDKKGNESYKSIISLGEGQSPSKISIIGNYIYYYNNQTIYRITTTHNQLENIINVKKNKGIIKHKNNLYVNLESNGLHQLSVDKLKPIWELKWTSRQELLFSIEFNNEYSLVGMHNNCLYLFNGKELKRFNIHSQSYLDENILVGAKDISETIFAVSTLTGGCLLINKNTGKTEHTINYHSGLSDNEVFAIETDRENGLWIAHGQGLTRASLDKAIKNFSSYPGLEGYLISVVSYNHTIYAATSEGVFYLDAAKDQEEYKKILFETKEKKKDSKHPNKKIFAAMFSLMERSNTKKEILTNPAEKLVQSSGYFPANYIFRKAGNFHGKCKQFLISNNHLLALSSIGLYEIDHSRQGRLIVKDDGINIIYSSPSSNKIYAGLKNGLIAIRFNDKVWNLETNYKIKCPVLSLCEDNQKHLWISSPGKILKLEFNHMGRQVQYKEYFIEGNGVENSIIQQIHGKITFFFTSSVYLYNKEDDAIVHHPSLITNNSTDDFIFSQSNLTWQRRKEDWLGLDAHSENNDFNTPLLSLFKDIRSIYADNDKNLWIIDGKDELHRIDKQYRLFEEPEFNLHIREITNDNGKQLTLNELELDHTNKSVNFYLAAPHYLDESSIKYQYFLKGMMEDWSSWTSSSLLKFPFLPSGEYLLQIRAKNVLGNVSQIKSIEFKIYPPFWKKNWFYFSEIMFFSMLIILSIMLNQKKKNYFLTKILAFVTLIIIIEFIHNLVSSVINVGVMDNPLMRLGADVMLALLISPIEKILEIVLFKRKRQIAQLAILYRKKLGASTTLNKLLF